MIDTIPMSRGPIQSSREMTDLNSFHRYRILHPVKTHGMSHVYRAMYYGKHGFRCPVAIKISAKSSATDPHIHHEARLLSTLSAPNLPRVYDTGAIQGYAYFSMEWIEGYSLRTVLKKTAIPLPVCVNLLYQICNALSALHQRPQSIVHSDIKPANIMMHADGHLTLIDLGISTQVGTEPPASPYGTVAYMAPEQLYLQTITPRTDIYSLGVVLFEMLVGQRLHAGKIPQILEQRRNEPMFIKRQLKQHIQRQHRPLLPLLQQCLSQHPNTRPRNIETVREKLRTFMHPLRAQRETRKWVSKGLHRVTNGTGSNSIRTKS